MIRYLKGDKSASSVSGCREFFESIRAYLSGVSMDAFDLETGGDIQRGKRFAVPIGEEALNPHAAEVLLAGLMPSGIRDYSLISADNNERALIAHLIQTLDATHTSGGIIAGHNILGFDIPMLVGRARLLKLPIPQWLSLSANRQNRARQLENRVFDTYRIFSPYSQFPQDGISLGDLSYLWGRTLGSHGANFGDIWRAANPQDRSMLKLYNLWNLLDSVTLAVFLGIPDLMRQKYGPHMLTPTITPTIHVIDPRFELPLVSVVDSQDAPQHTVFSWITSPQPSLWDTGPNLTKVWENKTDEAKAAYPHRSGRLNAQAVRIVGFMATDPGGYVHHLDVADEMAAIAAGIAWLKPRAEDSGVWIQDLVASKWLAVLRASIYNAILPGWFLHPLKRSFRDFDRVSKTEGFTLLNFSSAAGLIDDETEEFNPPLYTGQEEAAFSDACKGWLYAANSFLSVLNPVESVVGGNGRAAGRE